MSIRLINSDSLDISNLLSRILYLENIIFAQETGNGISHGTNLLAHINSNYVAKDGNFIIADSTSSSPNVFLPINPKVAEIVTVANIGITNNPVNVIGGYHNINSSIKPFVLSNLETKVFIYTGNNYGWVTINDNSVNSWEYVNSSQSITNSSNLFVDTSLIPITITFPDTPSFGSFVTITDIAGSFSAHHCILDGNGKNLISNNSVVDLDINFLSITFVYNGKSWIMAETAGTPVTIINTSTYTNILTNQVLLVDSSSSSVTLILPNEPADIFTFTICDFSGTFDNNPCILELSNPLHKINNQQSPLILDIKYGSITVIFSQNEWLIKA